MHDGVRLPHSPPSKPGCHRSVRCASAERHADCCERSCKHPGQLCKSAGEVDLLITVLLEERAECAATLQRFVKVRIGTWAIRAHSDQIAVAASTVTYADGSEWFTRRVT